jgi:hypothetical protein
MIATRFTQLVGCAVPIQQAGMGAAAPPAGSGSVGGRCTRNVGHRSTGADGHHVR